MVVFFFTLTCRGFYIQLVDVKWQMLTCKDFTKFDKSRLENLLFSLINVIVHFDDCFQVSHYSCAM